MNPHSMRRAVTLAASMALVTACGGTSDAPSTQSAATAEPATSEAPTSHADPAAANTAEEATLASRTTEEYATENQVASIVAGYEQDWRETIESAGSCRFLYVLDEVDLDPLEDAQRTTCYLDEVTTGVEASVAWKAIQELDVPPSMGDIVDETNDLLLRLQDQDLEEVCGEVFGDLADTQDCHLALGDRFVTYGQLETTLDRWGPYLGG